MKIKKPTSQLTKQSPPLRDDKLDLPTLIEGEDYYLDKNNLFVFTKQYHLKRGHCCKNNCKHCPY